eukprot:4496550-Pleurochrysis_carterae.AAC.1
MSASTAAAAAVACVTSPGWWNARTVMRSQSDLTSTPPSPAWSTMSVSAAIASPPPLLAAPC